MRNGVGVTHEVRERERESSLKGDKKRSAKNGQKIEREVDGGT